MVKKTRSAHDPQSFGGDLERILAFLANLPHDESQWVTPTEIAAGLRDTHGIGTHWRHVESLLHSNPDLAARRKRDSRWQYMILQAGLEHLSGSTGSISFVDPAKAIQATLSLHALLQSLTGTARICDPYLDPTSLDHLSACTPALAIKLLTKNIKDAGRVRTLHAAAKTEGRNIEIRVATSAPLHDRYIIDDKSMLILGTSLNGFGKKQGFVIQAGKDVRAVVLQAFDGTWAGASVWP